MEFEFVKEWIDRGDKEENYIFKFFCYFVAFNWLYNQETDENKEYERVKAYVEKKISKWDDYHPFLSLNQEWKWPVRDDKKGDVKSYIKNEEDDTVKLFLQIYQVRCNLFHGSKSMRTDRNKVLVEDSCKILHDFLIRIINVGLEGDYCAD